jgi:hypothetical protein
LLVFLCIIWFLWVYQIMQVMWLSHQLQTIFL